MEDWDAEIWLKYVLNYHKAYKVSDDNTGKNKYELDQTIEKLMTWTCC